tara:strand:+ start:1189 stop:1362 length:174 start_codon:yes stop_codon:yes gene_type:complete
MNKKETTIISVGLKEISILKASLENCSFSGKDVIPVAEVLKKLNKALEKITPIKDGL